MAFLKERSTLFTVPSSINARIIPFEIGFFNVAAKDFLVAETKAPSSLYQGLSKDLLHLTQTKKVFPSKALHFSSRSSFEVKKRIELSKMPHVNQGRELHLIFYGGFILHFRHQAKKYSLALSKGDWVYIPPGKEHWIELTGEATFTLVSFHSEDLKSFHEKRVFTKSKASTFFK